MNKKINDSPVLLADDDQNDKALFQFAAADARWGNRIIDFSDGDQLIEFLRHSRGHRPALIILDVKMPNIGGFEALNWLKRQRDLDLIPVVVMSNSGLEADVSKAAALGAAEYRMKPTRYSDLVHVAEDLRKKWLDRVPPHEQWDSGCEQVMTALVPHEFEAAKEKSLTRENKKYGVKRGL